MPIYCYECTKCGHADDEFQHIKDNTLTICPKCRGSTYERRIAPTHTDLQEYKKPIEMHSIAVTHPDDVREFKRRNPDIQCSDNPKDPLYGVPVIKNRRDKMSVLKKEGFVEKN